MAPKRPEVDVKDTNGLQTDCAPLSGHLPVAFAFSPRAIEFFSIRASSLARRFASSACFLADGALAMALHDGIGRNPLVFD